MTTRLNPIIAVKDVEASADWYQHIFGFKILNINEKFSVLVADDDIVLYLHKWSEEDEHPTFTDQSIKAGNGLLLYFRTDNLESIRTKIDEAGYSVTKDVHINPNNLCKEFSLKDPDGYFLTITEMNK